MQTWKLKDCLSLQNWTANWRCVSVARRWAPRCKLAKTVKSRNSTFVISSTYATNEHATNVFQSLCRRKGSPQGVTDSYSGYCARRLQAGARQQLGEPIGYSQQLFSGQQSTSHILRCPVGILLLSAQRSIETTFHSGDLRVSSHGLSLLAGKGARVPQTLFLHLPLRWGRVALCPEASAGM